MCQLEPIASLTRPVRYSVRHRLLAIALIPMLIILPALLGVSILRWNAKFDDALIWKATDDLTIARQYLGRLLDGAGEHLDAVANSWRFQQLLNGQDAPERLTSFLEEVAGSEDFDFLYIIAGDGRIVTGWRPPTSSTNPLHWPVVESALSGRSETAVDVFEASDLAAISPDLAQRAHIELIATKGSAPTTRTEEARGLVIQSASPLTLPTGETSALVGGILLNNNLTFVDTINDLIYHGTGQPDAGTGTVTLFLDDVRISTNVRLFEDSRAIGTRVSADVRDAVLLRGQTWRDSAYVVNDWYVSAYEPILDSFNQRVGMLYAGFIEKPFTEAKYQTLMEIGLAFLLAVIGTVPLFLTWAAQMFRPLESMNGTITKVESGDMNARTGQPVGGDEIGRVAEHLDRLLDRLGERDAQLRQWNEELNHRVDVRTSELQLANSQLEETTKQLIMSEKLAAIGEITAGVAHEINNPVAVMQGNLEVIRDAMGDRADLAKTEFRLVDQQLHRISDIVTRLLQFAKPGEYARLAEEYDAAEIVTDTLPLVEHLLNKTTIAIEKEYDATRLIVMNRTELQQVLVNLMVNAIHAMPDGGTLTLRTRDSQMVRRPGVAIAVTDTGGGMTPEIMQRIFDPFFTTKRREGTGLGLSISQMLVTRQGGNISVESEAGKGTTFTVWLPEAN